MNTIIKGDCIEELRKIDDNSIDLVYLDPPFYTQRVHSLKTRDAKNTYEFKDTWESFQDYSNFIEKCLVEYKRILKSTGSIFFHCDKTASHHIRVLLDKVFGIDNFQSEIIWHYRRWSNAKKGLLNSHQNIYFYSKTQKFKFNKMFEDYSPTTNIDQILQKRVRDDRNKSVYAKDKDGEVILNGTKKGVPLSTVWEIPYLNPKAKERTGYPTQKPIILLDRIINLATDKGDLVLDSFCGSGTTLVSAKLLHRKYIGIDISKDAVALAKKRLVECTKTESNLLKKGKDFYKTKPEKELAILKALNANPVFRNNGIDGFLKETHNDKPIAVRIQKESETLREAKNNLLRSSKSKSCDLLVLIKTHNMNDTFVEDGDDRLLILDSHELALRNSLKSLIRKSTTDVNEPDK